MLVKNAPVRKGGDKAILPPLKTHLWQTVLLLVAACLTHAGPSGSDKPAADGATGADSSSDAISEANQAKARLLKDVSVAIQPLVLLAAIPTTILRPHHCYCDYYL